MSQLNFNYLAPYFKDKKVFVTGHTGFKGAWLTQILARMGAKIYGYSLDSEQDHLFDLIDGDFMCERSTLEDINDVDYLEECLVDCEPDFVFHLAAQSLVLESYENPLKTFETNTYGTAIVLEMVRKLKNKCTVIMVTTDKVYENLEENRAFLESDQLGGFDPYSASKAACEIIIDSYRKSFFNPDKYDEHKKSIASVRAGNVIGGGDYAESRIVPDVIRALNRNKEVELRNPQATRPWQHVLEPLGAYLLLATKMVDEPTKFSEAYNIGPDKEDVLTVEELVKMGIDVMGKGSYIKQSPEASGKRHEANFLALDNTKFKEATGWQPTWTAKEAIKVTFGWHMAKGDADVKCLLQIQEFFIAKIDGSNES